MPKILIIEDEAAIRRVLTKILSEESDTYQVEEAEDGLSGVEKIKNELLPQKEVQKVINKTESIICFEDMSIMNRAHSLAYYELLGDADLMNKELSMYQKVTPSMIQHTAQQIFQENNRNTLYYYSKS